MKNGSSNVQVVEPPSAIKTVLVRWSKVKIDLDELARLRWIKKMTIPKICASLGKSRTAVKGSIRTIRNGGISQLNFEKSEKIIIQNAINEEIEIQGHKRKHSKQAG